MRTAPALVLAWPIAVLIAICGHVTSAAAQEGSSWKKPGLNWVVPYHFDESKQDRYFAVDPGFGPHLVGPEFLPRIQDNDCQRTPPKVPNTYIGLYNSSANKIALLLQIGQPPSPKPVVLNAGEFVTIECDQCGSVLATVPKGARPAAEDFIVSVLPGLVYEPRYNGNGKRWEIAQRVQ
jgi:hypothetical protein